MMGFGNLTFLPTNNTSKQIDYIISYQQHQNISALFYLIAFPIFEVISFLGNLTSYLIFTRPYFAHNPLYTYLRAKCLSSLTIDLAVSLINFICSNVSPSLSIIISKSEALNRLRCFQIVTALIVYFYDALLDIVIMLERYAELSNLRATFRRYQPSRVCIVLFIICSLTNVPFFFLLDSQNIQKIIIARTTSRESFFNYGESQFALSVNGDRIKRFEYVTQEILPTCILTIVVLVSFFKFRNDKHNVNTIASPSNTLMVNLALNRGYRCRHLKFNIKRTIYYFSVNQANRMLVKMVFILSTFALIKNVLVILKSYSFASSSYLIPVTDEINLVMLVQHSANFFIFFGSNHFFRIRFINEITIFFKTK